MIKNCYIHIPFCSSICSYCDFSKLLYDEKTVDKYLDELKKEINSIYKGEQLNTIYIGGGTPSSLNLVQLEKLFKIISIFNKDKSCEFTIECNFENTTEEKLKLFKKYGVNRLSFGLESINKKENVFLNRVFDKDNVLNIIKCAKKLGFNNINVDIIYALINQNIANLKKTLDFVINLDIEHISTYSLIIENNTLLKIKNIKNIDEDLDYEMYMFICKYLKEKGFIHYEISNFAKEGYYSRHNDTYWKNEMYYGFGLGASSYVDNERYTNTRSITNYLKGKYKLDREILTTMDIMNYEIILNLRRKNGINKISFRKKFKKDIKECYNYSELIKNKLLVEDKNNIYINEDKWYISNEIIIKFLEGVKYEI